MPFSLNKLLSCWADPVKDEISNSSKEVAWVLLLTWSLILKLILGPPNEIVVSSSSRISSSKEILYEIDSATSSTTHRVDFIWNWGGKGSYSLIRTVAPSKAILLAIIVWFEPKFNKKSGK